MSISQISHVSLHTTDLRQAERYYRQLFLLDVAFREAETPDGWRRLPPGKSWEDAEKAGIQLGMVMLHREGLALAIELVPDLSPRGPISHIGLLVDEEELKRLRRILPDFDCRIEFQSESTTVFDDKFGVRWEPSLTEYTQPSEIGAQKERWLEI